MVIQFQYLWFQIRRAFRCFGRMLLAVVLLAAVCAVFFTASDQFADHTSQEAAAAPFTVAVSIPPDSGLTYGIALGMVSQMDSFQGMCTVVRVDSEEQARAMLDSGDAQAAVLIPAGMIHSIRDGSNLPAVILYPAEPSVETVVFRNLVDSLAHMLSDAQAGVYALYDIYAGFGASDAIQDRANSELNSLYINMVLNRPKLFVRESLVMPDGSDAAASDADGAGSDLTASSSGSAVSDPVISDSASADTVSVPDWMPYLSGALTLLLLLSGICLCGYLLPQAEVLEQALLRRGISRGMLRTAPFFGAWAVTFFLFLIPYFLIVLLPFSILPVKPGVPLLLTLAVSCLFSASLELFLCRICRTREISMLVLFFAALLLVFSGGGLLPAAFLPRLCRRLFAVNPAHMLQSALTAALCGGMDWSANAALALIAAVLLALSCSPASDRCFAASRFFAASRTDKGQTAASAGKQERDNTDRRRPKPFRFRPAAWTLLLMKRALRRPLYWILAAAILSIGAAAALFPASRSIDAAVFAADPDAQTQAILDQLTTDQSGRLYRFYLVSSEEELREDVEAGTAECGFLFPDHLISDLSSGGQELIRIETGAATTLDTMIREDVYAAILDSYAPVVLEQYILDSGDVEIPDAAALHDSVLSSVTDWMNSGATFHVEYEDVPDSFFSNETAFQLPLRGLWALLLFAAVMAGTAQYRQDAKKGTLLLRFAKESGYVPCLYALSAAALPAAAGLAGLSVSGQGVWIGKELGCLMFYLLLILLLSQFLCRLIKSQVLFDLLIPIGIVFCLLYAPVITDLSPMLPGGSLLSWAAPVSWYLKWF